MKYIPWVIRVIMVLILFYYFGAAEKVVGLYNTRLLQVQSAMQGSEISGELTLQLMVYGMEMTVYVILYCMFEFLINKRIEKQ